jgi:hypothetical protein
MHPYTVFCPILSESGHAFTKIVCNRKAISGESMNILKRNEGVYVVLRSPGE